jgi:hypothetical protein
LAQYEGVHPISQICEECLRLAKEAATEQQQKVLEEMAEAWRKLAEESESKIR